MLQRSKTNVGLRDATNVALFLLIPMVNDTNLNKLESFIHYPDFLAIWVLTANVLRQKPQGEHSILNRCFSKRENQLTLVLWLFPEFFLFTCCIS